MLRESVVVLLLALGAFAVSNDTMCELKGEKGVKGENGHPGIQGHRGYKGDKGEDGARGTDGTKGDPGTRGLPGPRGSEGPAGSFGAPGKAGPRGPPGNTGSQGPVGPPGLPGLKGQSGLKGDKGNIGGNGLAGADGKPGPPGHRGPVGGRGFKGVQGERGDPGHKGEQGPQGIPGPAIDPQTLNDYFQPVKSLMSQVATLREELESQKVESAQLEERLANLTSLVTNIQNSSGTTSEKYQKRYIYTSCQDAMERGMTMSGVYAVDPSNGSDPFSVYCDMTTDGGGWTVFQRRQDGSVDFYRNWTDYQNGFGDLNREFWLGLDKIHRLTETAQLLRIDLQDFDGSRRYAKYALFTIGNGDMKYALTIGQYSGDAGDSLGYHNGMKFSTKDSDNDSNCAVYYQSAWWYFSCYRSNLNGVYINDGSSTDDKGLKWIDWKTNVMKFSEMRMRIRS